MNQPGSKTRIAILGGGIAGLTTAYELISQPQGAEKYDVTVYQMGWRVGGKGASGRNPDAGQRIEEHGLHVWSGFYENAFALMRQCYPQLRRVPGKDPLATVFPVKDRPDISPAFRHSTSYTLEEFIDGRWYDWILGTPCNDMEPGDGREMTPWDYFKIGIEWMVKLVESLFAPGLAVGAATPRPLPRWVESHLKEIQAEAEFLAAGGQPDAPAAADPASAAVVTAGTAAAAAAAATGSGTATVETSFLMTVEHQFVRLAYSIVSKFESHDPVDHPAASHNAIDWLIDRFLRWLPEHLGSLLLSDTRIRRIYILLDMLGTLIRGVIRDGVLVHGYHVIDQYDFREWLQRHGASDVTAYSCLVRGYYDYCFAYEDGLSSKPRMAAGTGLLHLLRLLMQDTGAVFFRMQSGMGDTVFGPLYLVLRDMGVKFEFFHKVKDLHLSQDKAYVERIDIEIQATVTPEARAQVHTVQGRDYTGSYWPLVDVKGLPSWPSVPLYDQLAEGQVLKEKHIDLESPWSDWNGVGERTLVLGEDFDIVVVAMSHAPLRYLTRELSAASETWRNMVEQLKTTLTIGVQFWCNKTWADYGCDYELPLITGYAQPIQTWGDFSQVLPREAWPDDHAPRSVSYLCGNMPDPVQTPDFSDHAYPRVQYERARTMAWQWLSDNGEIVWPKASTPFNPSGVRLSELFDPAEGGDEARFNAQFFRANISPSERYVLCIPGDNSYRLKQGKTPFVNLYAAGDYVYTGLLGSIEASVMTGMMASRSISGYPEKIVGEVVID